MPEVSEGWFSPVSMGRFHYFIESSQDYRCLCGFHKLKKSRFNFRHEVRMEEKCYDCLAIFMEMSGISFRRAVSSQRACRDILPRVQP
jgi:hypothetical protein